MTFNALCKVSSSPMLAPVGLDHTDPLNPVANGLMRHPEFDAAVRLYLDRILEWRREMGVFNRVATTDGLHALTYLIFFHAANETGAPEHGATFSKLLAICEARGHCGSRALRTTLALSRVFGFIHLAPTTADKRMRSYVPSEKLLNLTRRQFSIVFACLDLLMPDAETGLMSGPVNRSDPDALAKVLATSGKAFIEHNIEIAEVFPDLNALLALAGGGPTFMSLARARIRGLAFPSAAAIAKEFHISQTQARKVIKAASDRGLVTVTDRGAVTNADALVAQQRAIIAREFALHAKFAFGLSDCFNK